MRNTEFVLGLIGSIFGLIGAVIAIFIGGIDSAINDSSEVTTLGWSAIILSILALIGSITVKKKPKAGGIMMLVSAVGGFISIFMFYLIPAILLLIAGLMGIFRKDKNKT